MGTIKYYNLEDSELFIFDEFVINQVKEGVVIEPKYNDLLNECIQKHFTGQNMVYISNRVKSYSVNPLIYPETEKIPNLIAIAMIPDTDLMRKNAEFEREFYDKPYEVFERLSDAIKWAHQMVGNQDAEDHLDSEENLQKKSSEN